MKDQWRDELFARARGEANPTDDDRRRVREALGRKVRMSAGGVALSASASLAPAKAAASAVLAPAKVVAAAGSTGVKVAGGLSALAVAKVAVVVATAVALGAVLAPRTRAPSSVPPREASATARASAASGATDAKHAPAADDVLAESVPMAALQRTPGTLKESLPRGAPSSPETGLSKSATDANGMAGPWPRRAARRGASDEASASSVPSAASPVATGDPSAEVALMSEMQLALRSGDAPRALTLVEEHERRFPASAWAPEREGARVLALCSQGRSEAARALGQAFIASHPRSPLDARVRSTCALAPPSR